MSMDNWDQLVQTQLLQAQALESLADAFSSTVTFPGVVNIGTLNATTVNATTVNATAANANFLYLPMSLLTCTDGVNADLPVLSSFAFVTGPDADYTLSGFSATPPSNGQVLLVFNPNNTGTTIFLSVTHQDPSSTPPNQIFTNTGTTRLFLPPVSVRFIYDSGGPFWILVE